MIKINNVLPLTIGIEQAGCILKVNAQGTNTRHNELVFQCELFLNYASATSGKSPVSIESGSPFYAIQQPISDTLMNVISTYALSHPTTINNGIDLFTAMSKAYYSIAAKKLQEMVDAHNGANPDNLIVLDIEILG